MIDSAEKPTFWKARIVPYAMKERVHCELDRLLKEVIIESVNYSDWVTPIVPILKKDGSIRICVDYTITINKVNKIYGYPILRIEDIYAHFARGKLFTTID